MSAPQSRFVKACKAEPVDTTPVWFMRQAGRYMPEYRAIREKYPLIEICQHPEIAGEVTMQDVRAMKPFDAESDLAYVMDAIRILRRALGGVPLIGFCGAPFTVASYIIEG